jgi:hypothetical protein
VLVSGCNTPTIGQRKEAELTLTGKVLVIPLRDAAQYYFDSEDGKLVADAVLNSLKFNAGTLSAIDYNMVRGPIRGAVLETSLTKEEWAAIGRDAGVDYMVYGTIGSLSWRDTDDPVIPRCIFTVTYYVFDVAAADVIYTNTIAGSYHYMKYGDKGMSVFDMGGEGLRTRALAYIGEIIARTFYAYNTNDFEEGSIRSAAHKTEIKKRK